MENLELYCSFFVRGRPIPKPRMTKADKFRKRPVVLNYRQWCDEIAVAWMKVQRKVIQTTSQKKFLQIGIGIGIYIAGKAKGDVDNYLKGVCDALVKARIIPDDKVANVPFIANSFVKELCPECELRPFGKDNCSHVKECQKGGAEIRLYKPSYQPSARSKAAEQIARQGRPPLSIVR